MRIQAWERFVPDVGDNRAKHARGEPAMVFTIRPVTARVWSRFWRAILEDKARLAAHRERIAEHGDDAALALTVTLATLDDGLAELLWLPSVGAIEHFPDVGVPVPDGAALWALRDQLDSTAADVISSVLQAIVQRAKLEEGLARPLASVSGPPGSPGPASMPGGIAGSAARAD